MYFTCNHSMCNQLVVNMILILVVCSLMSNAGAHMNLTEGSTCFINGTNKGTCVGAKSCPSFNLVELTKRDLLESEVCSFNNIEPVICCLDCEPYTRDYRDSAITGDGYLWKDGNKSWDKCVEYLGRREYGCTKLRKLDQRKLYNVKKKCIYTERQQTGASWLYALLNRRKNEIAHIALLEYGDESREPQWLCAGALISERFILTAAQCANNPQLGPVSFVSLGVSRRDDTSEFRERYKVKCFIQHPEYQPPAVYHDIGLVMTENEIVFNSNILPICLVYGPPWDDNGELLAWGSVAFRSGNRTGQEQLFRVVSTTKYNAARCSFRYQSQLPQRVNSTLQACYEEENINEASCESLPGMPLEVKGRKLNGDIISCARFVVAVASSNRSCELDSNISLYTRLPAYIPWIESIVWPEV